MYDRKHRIQVAFDAETVAEATGIKLDPDTFEEHLDFATEYQLAMYRLGSKSKREQTRPHVRHGLMYSTLMQLRALYLFAMAEHQMEIGKGGRLNEMERAAVWRELERTGKVEFGPARLYHATDPQNTTLRQHLNSN
ncbi:hypothetical protein SEA_WENTWORTH_83 [Streptomyces phage Wentworth]|nr:hypothetical protein SEA_WENTWORTH_83 [Streptomyces phage Wentworth]